MAKLIIRQLTEADIPNVVPLLLSMWVEHAKKEPGVLDKNYIKKYDPAGYCRRAIDDPKQQIFVAEQDNEVAGIARIEIEDIDVNMYNFRQAAYFDDLVVVPKFRRHGIGDKLVKHRIEYAKAKGIKVCRSKIYSFNEASKMLAEKNGFRDIYNFYYKFI